MTENEAIKRVKEFGLHHAIGDLPNSAFTVKAFEMAIAALEKQIPKKYREIYPCKSVKYYQCPCCDGLLHINENYCGECGQAIDWSDTD